MKPDDVTPVPVVGQYWAALSPLAFMQCTISDGNSNIVFKSWAPHTPLDNSEVAYIWPSVHAKFLWCRQDAVPSTVKGLLKDRVFVGDAWLVLEIERLIFVGPDTDEKLVHFHADWDLRGLFDQGAPRKFLLFQPGPERLSVQTEGATIFDRVLNDDLLV